tara:strand:+ start:580 stop:1065 length:486 start_codon:yes stop_codon:yes gene_type:complete
VAVWVAISSRNQAKAASEENLKIQKRMEVNQFYPIIELDAPLKNNAIQLLIKNRSDTNSASSYTVKCVLRVFAKKFSINYEAELKGGEITNNSTGTIDPESVNFYLVNSLPLIMRESIDELHIVVRFWVQYKATHPDSMPMSEEKIVYLTRNDDGLVVKKA